MFRKLIQKMAGDQVRRELALQVRYWLQERALVLPMQTVEELSAKLHVSPEAVIAVETEVQRLALAELDKYVAR